jgi:SAM-dependent methyltransferase
VREWLNSQAAGGYVDYDPANGTYTLAPEQAMLLADEDSPVFFPPAWEISASMWFDRERTRDAFASGEGIAWGNHHVCLHRGVAGFFRGLYSASLVDEWLPALEGVTPKLEAGARVADIGCGYGHSTMLMADAFPRSTFDGFDAHEPSIVRARENAAASGCADRLQYAVRDAKSYPADGYDLICFFDCLHDLGDPVGAAAHAREALAPDGTVMLVEPRAGDRVEDNLHPVGRLFYACSTALCCAHSLSEEVVTALGAQAGESRLIDVLQRAGFQRTRCAASTPFNMVIEARP